MATKKETKTATKKTHITKKTQYVDEEKITKKGSTQKTTKKKPDDFDGLKVKEITPEKLVETPSDILSKDEIDEILETPIPDPENIDLHLDSNIVPKPIPKGKPEKLETLVVNEDLEDPECKKEELGMITTADLKPPPIVKAKKAHNAANDVIITTTDFKPRKWGESKKL